MAQLLTRLLALTLVLGLALSETAPRWPHPMQASKKYTGRSPLVQHSPAYRYPEAELFSLSRDQLAHLRRVLKKFPLEKSPLKVVYDIAESVGKDEYLDWESLLDLYDTGDVRQMLIDDPVLREQVTSYRPVKTYGGRQMARNDEDGVPPPEERPQTQGYEGCFADYDAYMGPYADMFRYETELVLKDQYPLLFPDPVDPPLPEAGWEGTILDSNAKQPPGVASGRLHWVGSVELCKDVLIEHNVSIGGTPELRVFKGMYARLDMPLDVDVLNSVLGTNLTTLWPFQYGTCVPDTCSHSNITYYIEEGNPVLKYLFSDSNLLSLGLLTKRNVTTIYTGQVTDFQNEKASKAAFGILLGGGIIILFSTCYDGWGRHREIRKKIRKHLGKKGNKNKELTVEEVKAAKEFLYQPPGFGDKMELAFAGYSLYTNIRNVFTTRREHGQFHVPVLDGLRVLSFLWLIKGLTYVYGIVYFECWTTDNLLTALQEFSKEWSFMSILGVYHANTVLFFISGFVCVQMWYKTFYRHGEKLTFFMCIEYILLRWLAIMPAMMGMLMIFTCLYRYISEGPLNPPFIADAEHCRDTWWITFLLFHNVIRTNEQCFAWSWMFGAVWQLNLVSLVILIPLVLAPIGGYVLIFLMYVAHIVVTVIWNQKVFDGEKSWFFDIVQTPWCNAGPYCIGMMMAIILRKTKGEWKSKGQRAAIFFLWLLSIAGIMLVVYLPWDKLKGEGKDWPRQGQIAFDVLAPQIIAFSVAWITWACHRGYGGIVGNLLQWRAFTTLARISFPAAIFMAPAMISYFYGRLTTFYIAESHMGHLYYGQLIRVFIFALMAALFYQHPIARSMKKQMTAKTKLEVFLHCRHPEILSQFIGDKEEDEPIWEALEGRQSESKKDGGGAYPVAPLTSVDVMRGMKPIGGYVPHQEVGGLPELVENYGKVPIVNGVQANTKENLYPILNVEAQIPPPQYEPLIIDPSNQQTTAF